MSKQFNEDGTYNKTDWKAGDKITATKLNKIEDAIEAVNNNDISRHEEADARLDALEAGVVANKQEIEAKVDALEDTVVSNKDAADLDIYRIDQHMTLLDKKIDEGVAEVYTVAETVDGKIAEADASMKAQVAEADAIVEQGKVDINAIIDECEQITDLETINEQLEHIEMKNSWYVFVEEFGAKPNVVECQADKIQQAIDSGAGRIIFGQGTYHISKPIKLKRGTVLEGVGTFDSININSQIKLMDNSNCSALLSPYAQGLNATHFVGLKNLYINGNKTNNTEENVLVDFRGLYVGSFIENCMLCDNYGPALELGKGADVNIRHLWVVGNDTKDYGVIINRDLDDGSDGIMYFDNIYIEHTSNGTKPETSPKEDETVRGKGILINAPVQLIINTVHFEGHSIPITIKGNAGYINIPSISTAHCGSSKEPSSSIIRFLDALPYHVDINNVKTSKITNMNNIVLADGFNNNEFVNVPFGTGFLGKWSYERHGYAKDYGTRGTSFINNVKVIRNGGYSGISLEFDYGSVKQSLQSTNPELLSVFSNNSGNNIELINFRSKSGANFVNALAPIVLHEKIENNTFYGLYSIGRVGNAMYYCPVDGTPYNVPTVIFKDYDAISHTPNYEGQIFVNTKTKKVWISCGLTSSDWISLN